MKKLIILILLIGLTACGLPEPPFGGSKIPDHLKLKAPKELIKIHNIIIEYDYDEEGNPIEATKREHISYKYRSKNPSKLFKDEILERRTINTITQFLGENKYVATGFLGQKFYKETENSEWYDVFYATTTIEAFDEQMKVSWINSLFRKALADDTGFQDPGTMATDNSNGGQWDFANPNNAKASDNAYATSQAIGGTYATYYLKATNFGFAVDTDATIDGVEVDIEKYCDVGSGSVKDEEISLVDESGTVTGDNKADTVSTWVTADPDSYITSGGADDDWSVTLTESVVEHSNFGMVISAFLNKGSGPATAHIDHIRMKVYYSVAAPSDSCTYSGSGDWYIYRSDNCYITSDVYVNGDCHFVNDAYGTFGTTAEISCENIHVGTGFIIQTSGSGILSGRP